MALTVGTKLGPYEIRSQLGAGGMGEVYRAVDTRLDRTVAVKVLASHLSSLPDGKTLYYLDAFQKLTAVDVEVAGEFVAYGAATNPFPNWYPPLHSHRRLRCVS